MKRCTIALLLAASVAQAQPAMPSEPALREATRFGALATLAPLCGARDETWSEDLRAATVQRATGADVHDLDSLHAAPGHELAEAAIGFADTEALEDFAEEAPDATCSAVRANPDLPAADAHVRAWRIRSGRSAS